MNINSPEGWPSRSSKQVQFMFALQGKGACLWGGGGLWVIPAHIRSQPALYGKA